MLIYGFVLFLLIEQGSNQFEYTESLILLKLDLGG